MVENQPANITITLNHVHAVVTWKRSVRLYRVNSPVEAHWQGETSYNLVLVHRRGVVLASRPGMYEMSMPDDDQHTLKVQRVRSTDVGQLVVVASNQFGSDLCALQLTLAGGLGPGGAPDIWRVVTLLRSCYSAAEV